MLTIQTSALQKQLADLKKQIKVKLENMVRGFSYSVAIQATGKTPLGNSEKYPDFYEAREKAYGFDPIEGLARGAWAASIGSPSNTLHLNYGKSSEDDALNQVKMVLQSYTLGQEVYITNNLPYIGNLENNYSPQTQGAGIMRPTIEAVYRVTSYRLHTFYKES